MNRPIPESYWVDPKRFLAGEYPGGFENAKSMRRRIDAFLEAGIDTFFDLTQPNELISYETILGEQARMHEIEPAYHRFAIRDRHIPSREAMITLLDAIDDALSAGRNIYVHCWGGVGRTGTTVGCYLVRRGMANDKALARVGTWFKTMPKHIFFPTSPETEVQIQFVRDWREDGSVNGNGQDSSAG